MNLLGVSVRVNFVNFSEKISQFLSLRSSSFFRAKGWEEGRGIASRAMRKRLSSRARSHPRDRHRIYRLVKIVVRLLRGVCLIDSRPGSPLTASPPSKPVCVSSERPREDACLRRLREISLRVANGSEFSLLSTVLLNPLVSTRCASPLPGHSSALRSAADTNPSRASFVATRHFDGYFYTARSCV